ncbi:MAG: aspartate kinase [Promethearchaeota archaeon]|nr:MAG: aspartate kinase [Candidatus Lokiarchaeota archaeon]
MTIVIMKFGGSCLVDDKAFNKIHEITKIYEKEKKVYVASAFNGITDLLLNTARNVSDEALVDKNMALIEKKHLDVIEEIFEDTSPQYIQAKKWVDKILSELDDAFEDIKEFGLEPYYVDYVSGFGEILSTYILNEYLKSKDFDSVYIPANKVIITNDNFNKAYPLYKLTNTRVRNKLIPLLEGMNKEFIFCVTGFIGRNKIGYTTTLGRGGSDYTATILAHSLHEVGKDKDIKVILWKDVDGLLAINPNYVPEASLIKYLDYREAKEIANFGAKVLHPKCLEALEINKIPLEIRNFDKPLEEKNFTIISEKTDEDQIKGISTIEKATIITITSGSMVDVPGVLAKIFKIMGKNDISVSLVSQSASEISTSFVVKEEDEEKARNALDMSIEFKEFFRIHFEQVAIINITGTRVLKNKTKAMIFTALDKQHIHVKALSQSSEELNLSLVINQDQLLDAIKVIHTDLCEDFGEIKCDD